MPLKQALLALVASLLTGLPPSAVSQECRFILEQAKLKNDTNRLKVRLEEVQDVIDLATRRKVFEDVLLRQHFPVSGTEVVLGLWRRSRAAGIEDSSAYEYWTVQLPRLSEGAKYGLPSAHTAAFFSAGGTAWVGHGRGFYGSQISGSVTIRALTATSAMIDVNIRVHGTFASQRGVPTEEFGLRGEYSVPIVSSTDVLALERQCFGIEQK